MLFCLKITYLILSIIIKYQKYAVYVTIILAWNKSLTITGK